MGEAKLLIVGGSGFIGRALVAVADAKGIGAVALSRSGREGQNRYVREARVSRYDDHVALMSLAGGCRSAIVVAGRAHVAKGAAADEGAFMLANRDMPLAVADAFAQAGGRRIVLVSSVAVHGPPGADDCLRESDSPAPVTAYARSKLAGEQSLHQTCDRLGLELVIVRPPMVYGPDAPGHFGQLLRAAVRGIPLPLGSIRNCRSLIGVENLADLLVECALHPAAAGRTFLAADDENLSTAEIAGCLYDAAGHRGRLISIPPAILKTALRIAGQSATAARLFDDLVVDGSLVRRLLSWRPPSATRDGLVRSVRESVR